MASNYGDNYWYREYLEYKKKKDRDISHLETDVSNLEKKLVQYKTAKTKLQQEKQRLQTQTKEYKQQSQKDKKFISNLKTNASNLENKLVQYKTAQTKLQQEKQSLQTQIEENKQQSQKDKEFISNLETNASNLGNQLVQHKTTQTKLQQEKQTLEAQIIELQSKPKPNSHSQNAIFQFCETKKNAIKPREQVQKIQKEINALYDKHKKVLTTWNKFSSEMDNEFKQCINRHDQDMDDEKAAKDVIKAHILLTSYSKCKILWQQQQNRMESVSDFISEVVGQKYKAKDFVCENEEFFRVSTAKYNEEITKYRKTQQTRLRLETELKTTLKELNRYCDKENEVNKQKCELLDSLNISRTEMDGYKLILTRSSDLIQQYRQFDDVNEENIEKMKKYFETKWDKCMQSWYEWDCESIICWIQYLQQKKELMLSNEIDLPKILKQMKNAKVIGKSFLKIDKDDLKSIGFEILSDRKEVFRNIRQLISKYPINKSDEGQINDTMTQNKVPTEFLCPLSKEIMKNPVTIFDGNTYELTAINVYLKKHQKSPVTQRCCDEEDIWFQPNRKLKQKIDAFLYVNQQSLAPCPMDKWTQT